MSGAAGAAAPDGRGGPLETIRYRAFGVASTVVAALFLFFFAYPLARMLYVAFVKKGEFSTAAFAETFADPDLGPLLIDTTLVVVIGSVVAMAIATLFAWLNERTDASMGWASRLLPLVPLMLPAIALSTGWFFLAHERAGLLNIGLRGLAGLVGLDWWSERGPFHIASWPGLVFVYTLYLVPFAYLLVAAAFRNFDSSLEEASRVAGAGAWRTFTRVSAPGILPALAAAVFLVGVTALSNFSIPVIIGTAARIDVLSVRIVRMVRDAYPPRVDEAVVLSIFVVVAVAILFWLQRQVSMRQRHVVIGGKGGHSTRIPLGRWKWPARVLMIGYLAAASAVPLLGLFFVSLQRFWSSNLTAQSFTLDVLKALFVGESLTRKALQTSLGLGVVGATISILLATMLMLYVRQRHGVFPKVVDAAAKAPSAVSHTVIGLAMVIALTGPPFHLAGTLTILLIAYLVIYMPQAAISTGSGLDQVGGELIEASAVSGASQSRTFFRITLPLMRPALAAGWALLFVMIVGDLTASALLATNANPVVGFIIYDIFNSATYSSLAAIACVVGAISFAVVCAVLAFSRGSWGGQVAQ
ncbi:MAG: iron ABC transporter permease [Burkholderiales bacterium]|nr:iron ABC transporter permease [Burkholderiales bacterium]